MAHPHRLALLPLLLIPCLGIAACGEKNEPLGPEARRVDLALDFQPNAVHAGALTAEDGGFDRKRGVDLEVRTPAASTDSLKLLATGRADLSIVDIHDLGLARERGADVVGVGAIVQRPLAAVIARSGIRRPRELEGKRVGVTGVPSDEAVLRAIVQADGGDYGKVRRRTIGFSAVPTLLARRVDAVVTFWNAEGVALRKRGVRTREFRVDDFGAPRYPELVLATTRRTLRRDPELVRSTVAALADGTRAALDDRPAAVRRIVRASNSDEPLVKAQLGAVAAALEPPLKLDRRALEGWARFDARFGILETAPRVDEAFQLR
jgi:NitT/TauT family transport system substrate-binding protein/putative hydroxymethylpyrimidine transport system substrate-binding protein